MKQLTSFEKANANSIRTKNKKIWSNYLFLSDKNENREKALVTFTSPEVDMHDKLTEIKLIKSYFSKLLSNLKIDIDKFLVVEIGENKNNPHSHIQLFYTLKDFDKIYRVYIKTLLRFNLNQERCTFLQTDKSQTHIKYFSYILKEFSPKLSDSELMAFDKARNILRVKENKNMQFISHSHNLLTRPTYKHLYFKHKINYSNADFLYSNGFFHIQKKTRRNRFKIEWTIKPILELILYLILPSEKPLIRQKLQYINKGDKRVKFHMVYLRFNSLFGFT